MEKMREGRHVNEQQEMTSSEELVVGQISYDELLLELRI